MPPETKAQRQGRTDRFVVAAENGKLLEVQKALASGRQEPNALHSSRRASGLHLAASQGHATIVAALIAAGADPNLPLRGRSVAPAASGQWRLPPPPSGDRSRAPCSAARSGIDAGGDTPLHLAASGGHEAVVVALWALGHEAVERHSRNGRGLTPADIAWDYRNRSLLLLFEGGARPPLPPAVHEVSAHSASLRLGLAPAPPGRATAQRRPASSG